MKKNRLLALVLLLAMLCQCFAVTADTHAGHDHGASVLPGETAAADHNHADCDDHDHDHAHDAAAASADIVAPLANSPADTLCTECGEPCDSWYQYVSADGTASYHAPQCFYCWMYVEEAAVPCTPVASTATCLYAAQCSVCGYPDNAGSAPNPDAHTMTSWSYADSAQHMRFCDSCWADNTFEYENHYGGTATCMELAICEGCGNEYGDVGDHRFVDWQYANALEHYRYCGDCYAADTYEFGDHADETGDGLCDVCSGEMPAECQHTNMSGWYAYDSDLHASICNDCLSYEEYGDHRGGTPTCVAPANCEICGGFYGEPTGEHTAGEWVPYDYTQHFRYCTGCAMTETYEYENHYGGTATCVELAACEACGYLYGEFKAEHDWIVTGWFNGSQHHVGCSVSGCYASSTAPHYGGDGSCRPTCEGCNTAYTDANGEHTGLTEWMEFDEDTHFRYCTACNDLTTYEYAPHADETGDGLCDACGAEMPCQHTNMSGWYAYTSELHARICNDCLSYEEYGDHRGGTPTCVAPANCEICGGFYGEPTGEHTAGEWVPYDYTQHFRYCTGCAMTETYEYENHYGGTATCMDQAICEGCGFSYGDFSNLHPELSQWFPHNSKQHIRYCIYCGSYESEEYEDHYDETGDGLCDACGESMPCQHTNMSGWYYEDSTQHHRRCLDCNSPDSYEYENHYGGTATCSNGPVCEACGMGYGSPTGVHLNMSEWIPLDGTQHYRLCLDCGLGSSYEYANHYTDGPCVGVCAACGTQASDPNGEHSMTVWMPISQTQHYRYCSLCMDHATMEYAEHTGGSATCSSQAVCEVCGSAYGEYSDVHVMTDWVPVSNEQHYRYCSLCLADTTYEYGDHTGSAATCISHAICDVCGPVYGSLDPTNHTNMGDWTPHSNTQHQRICLDCVSPDSIEYADHDIGGSCFGTCTVCGTMDAFNLNAQHVMSDWTRWWGTGHENQHIRYCTACNHPSTFVFEDHYGGSADCANKAICDGCGSAYGDYDADSHRWNMWVWFQGTHFRTCDICGTFESGEHTGGDGSCTPVCEVCNELYIDATGEHTGMTAWLVASVTRHYRFCVQCGGNYEYAAHTGGVATCSSMAICEVCGTEYGDYDFDNHTRMSDWMGSSREQHSRYCLDCTQGREYASHDLGGACGGTCTVCGMEHALDPNGEHAISDWMPLDNTNHYRHCYLCNAWDTREYAEHDVGGLCYGTCIVCNRPASYDEDGEHHLVDWEQDWYSHSTTQHIRYCSTCLLNSTLEYEDHHGGAATCTEDGLCAACGAAYIPAIKHAFGKWTYNGDGTHTRICRNDATHTETEDCTGGTATCTEDGVCEVCDGAYLPATKHHWGEWKYNGDGTHTRVCANDAAHTETEDCSGGTATCTEDGICEVCDGAYLPAIKHSWGTWTYNNDGTHTRVCANDAAHTETEDCSGGTATCTEDGVCKVCDGAYLPAIKHSWGEWKSNEDGTHTRICRNDAAHTETDVHHWSDWALLNDEVHQRVCADCSATEEGSHIGGTATCVDLRICDVCSGAYGDYDFTVDGHDYILDKTEHATCLDTGLLTYICQREGCPDPVMEIVLETPGQHLYHNWEPVGDGTHIDHCNACGEDVIVECTLFAMDGFQVCPICGEYEGGVLPVLYAHDDDEALPMGTLVVRGGVPLEGMPFVITVTGSYAGKVIELDKAAIVTIPADAEGFTLVRIDMVDGTEVRTEIPFTCANGKLTFTAEAVGLFLLVPAE